ncbi:MAG TPA: hypothetical protein VFU63_14670 [Ktedonobacterales bacterium]|nr:hypothetical protein [Ktedonobacterales bacterium]
MPEKLRCARCGKRFKQANKKQIFCADCLAKERAARKNAPQLMSSSAGRPASGMPRHSEAGSQSSETPGITIVQATPPPEVGTFGSRARAVEHQRLHPPERPAQPLKTASQPAAPAAREATPATPTPQAKPSPKAKTAQPQPEKRSHQPRPTTPPFQLTDEIRAAIEQRYLELSQPVEFDGIRTQIAGELNVPKPIVKQVIREFRSSWQLPSWWELQAYRGTEDQLAHIRERYLPLLPVPPVGVHKQIASELQMEATQVYQAIRRLRAELKLPQYNPPETHKDETPAANESGSVTVGSAAVSTASPQE